MKEELIKIRYSENDYIALWKLSGKNNNINKNVLLTHGTFSNRKILNGISEYLIENGYNCWIFEWRNHGNSSNTNKDFNFETIANCDFKFVLDYLFEEINIPKLDCITHSGGGICLTIALINYPKYQNKINCITMFACQAFGAANTNINFLKIFFGKLLSRFYGTIPAGKIGREEVESYYFMKQWFNWNLEKKFESESGMNYKDLMNTIKTPILGISGAGDKFIAPREGCESYISAFKNKKNKYSYFGKKNGFKENYNHSRILHSQNAKEEIYPKVLEWISNSEIEHNEVF